MLRARAPRELTIVHNQLTGLLTKKLTTNIKGIRIYFLFIKGIVLNKWVCLLGLVFILACGNGNNGEEAFNPGLLSSDCVAQDVIDALKFGNWECENGSAILGVPRVGSGGIWRAVDCETLGTKNDTLEGVTPQSDTTFSVAAWIFRFVPDAEPQDRGPTTCSFSPFE